jgi:indolepyruvate ferredoxin oxidoreductase beta subunit
MTQQITNILLVGVGGQGILLASEILSEAAMLTGFDVKKSEIHGMSQRGGSVVSHVRYGREVFSPIIPEGEGDILFGFELMETCRSLPLIKNYFPDFLLVDGQKIARDAGNARAANTVLLGAVSRRLAIAEEFWMRALEKMVPPKALEVNNKAFLIGREL